MSDLMQRQIQESCELALPEGLKELMSDISREVIRAQPRDIYKFIANYLKSLLEVRETLAIACRVCNETWECACQVDINEQLRNIGLNDEDVEKAIDVVKEYLRKDPVKEQSLFLKLMRKIHIEENQVEPLKNALQKAFHKYKLVNTNLEAASGDSEESVAARHTLGLYNKEQPEDDIMFPTYRSKLKLFVRSAGSYMTFSQYSESSTRFARLSKISEERGSLDYTKENEEKTPPAVTFSFHVNALHRGSSDSDVAMDIILDSKQNEELNDDYKQQSIESDEDEEIIVEDITEEKEISDSPSIEESLDISPRGGDY